MKDETFVVSYPFSDNTYQTLHSQDGLLTAEVSGFYVDNTSKGNRSN